MMLVVATWRTHREAKDQRISRRISNNFFSMVSIWALVSILVIMISALSMVIVIVIIMILKEVAEIPDIVETMGPIVRGCAWQGPCCARQ
jgi:cobalamin synthase